MEYVALSGPVILIFVLTIYWALYVNPSTTNMAVKVPFTLFRLCLLAFKLVVLLGLLLLSCTSPVTEDVVGFTPIGCMVGQCTNFWKNTYEIGKKYNATHDKNGRLIGHHNGKK